MEVKSVCKQTVCLHFDCCIFLKYDVMSEYITPFWFAMLLNEYEIEFMFRKIRNIRNLGNVYIRNLGNVYKHRGKTSAHAWGTKKMARNLNAKL